MPSRNVIKVDIPDSYYHIYARGAGKLPIFYDDDDYVFFLQIFRRYLSPEELKDKLGRPYDKLHSSIELLAYCLMRNHFHLYVYQVDEKSMAHLMRSALTTYSKYFNYKYKRTGPLFESRYKAVRTSNDTYLMHITRYIHLNPKNWQAYTFSSIHSYEGTRKEDFVHPERILDLFSSRQSYMEFVADYEEIRDIYENIKRDLADTRFII